MAGGDGIRQSSGASGVPETPGAPFGVLGATGTSAAPPGASAGAALPVAPAPILAPPPAPVAPVAPAGFLPNAAHVPASVTVALDVLVRRNATSARLTLRPEALGGVDVRLRQTAKGLDVRLTADGADARSALAAAADVLRRQLEDQGITVLRLEVVDGSDGAPGGLAGDARGASGGARDPDAHGSASDAGGRPDGSRTVTTTLDLPLHPDPRTTLALPDGTRVDVLA